MVEVLTYGPFPTCLNTQERNSLLWKWHQRPAVKWMTKSTGDHEQLPHQVQITKGTGRWQGRVFSLMRKLPALTWSARRTVPPSEHQQASEASSSPGGRGVGLCSWARLQANPEAEVQVEPWCPTPGTASRPVPKQHLEHFSTYAAAIPRPLPKRQSGMSVCLGGASKVEL